MSLTGSGTRTKASPDCDPYLTVRRPLTRTLGALFVLASMITMPIGSRADSSRDEAHWLRLAVERVCPQPGLFGLDAQNAIPGSWYLDEMRFPDNRDPWRIVVRLLLPGADELTIERRQFNGRLRQFLVSYAVHGTDGTRPSLQAVADGTCTTQSGRAVRAVGNTWQYLDQLEGDLETLRWTETLQAAWPEGRDPGGIRVALVDSGLAYDQQFPLIQKTSCIAHYLLVFPRFQVFEQDFGVRLVAVAWKRIDVAGGFGAFKVLGERMGGPTSRCIDQFGGSFPVPERNHLVHVFPVRDLEVEHMAAEFLPEVEWTLGLFAGHSEQLAASLFGLIDEEREHHEAGEDGR